MKFKILILLFLLINKCLGANILVMALLASPSHYHWHKIYSLELVRRGHNVTIVSHEENKEQRKISNFTTITLEDITEKLHETLDLDDYSFTPLETFRMLTNWEVECCRLNLATNGLKTLMNYPKDFKFDLIVWDFHSGKCLYPLIDRFESPALLATSPFGNQPPIGHILGNRISAHIPFLISYSSDKMNFIDRFFNFIYVHGFNLHVRYVEYPLQEELARNFFKHDVASVEEYERRFTLMLVNSDPIFHYPEAMYPNSIPVSGLHIRPAKELPQDIKILLDGAKHGVIYVSFGTNLDFSKFEDYQQNAFLDAFKRIPQTVLIKSSRPLENTSQNVIVKQWLPQNDILAHPNLKLFITHGGALSMQEIIYHGVPVLGIPFFLDQHQNVVKVAKRKLGKYMQLKELNPQLVYDSIIEILNNDVYKENMKLRSRKFRDQPQTPMERAMFWTEYMIRHGSAEELNPSTRDMNIFQSYELDILATFVAIIFLVLVIIYQTFKILKIGFTTIFCKNNKKLKRN